MSFENQHNAAKTANRTDNNANLVPSEISGPTGANTYAPRNWLENPVTLTAAAAIGGQMGRELIPTGFDLLSSHQFASGGRWLNQKGTLGSELFGEGSAIARNAPKVNFAMAEHGVNEVSRAGLHPLAKAWQESRLTPAVATATSAEATVGAAGTEAATGLAGLRNSATQMAENAGKYLAEKPNLASAGRAALLIGGAAIADNYLDTNGYHLAVPGMAVGMMAAREGLLAPAAIGLGALSVSKFLGPANPDIERIMRPGMADTTLLAAAASMPLKGEAQAYTLGGAFVLGRMAHMSSGEAALSSGAVGLAAYAKTHNPYVAVAAGAGSYIGSRALGWMG